MEVPSQSSMPLTVGSFLKFGWTTFKKRPWFLIGVYLVLILVTIAIDALSEFVPNLASHFSVPLSLIIAFICILVRFLVDTYSGMLMIAFSLRAHDSIEKVKFSDFWQPKYFLKYLAALLLSGLIVCVGFVLFIVPGIIASMALMFVPNLVLDRGLGPIDALKESVRITRGNRWRLLSLTMATCLMSLIGILGFIVGIFVVLPVSYLAFIDAYRKITIAADSREVHHPLTIGEKGLLVSGFLSFIGIICLFYFIFANVLSTHKGLLIYPSDLPVSSLAPLNATHLPFNSITLINTSAEPITVTGIGIEASKLTDEAGIAGVALLENNGKQLGPTEQLDSDNRAVVGGTFTILPNYKRTFVITADISSCDHACPDNAEPVNISITKIFTTATEVHGELPLTGTQHVMNSPIKIGTVTTERIDAENSNVQVPLNQDLIFSQMKFVAGNEEDLTLHSIRYKYTGTLDHVNVSNVQVTIAEKNYPLAWSLDGPYATVSFSDGIPLVEGKTLSVSLHGSLSENTVIKNDENTVEFDIENRSDVYFTGQTYGYGVGPSGVSDTNSSPWLKGNIFTAVP